MTGSSFYFRMGSAVSFECTEGKLRISNLRSVYSFHIHLVTCAFSSDVSRKAGGRDPSLVVAFICKVSLGRSGQ